MPTIFNSKDSVFFVGGRGTKAGDADAGGGCTLEAWNDPAKFNKDLTKVMGPNGEPLGEATGCVVEAGAWSGSYYYTKLRGNFGEHILGKIANVEFTAVYPNGRYEVMDGGDDPVYDYWVDIDLEYISETTCDCWFGGAFDKAQTAWNNTDAMNGYNVIIHSNKNQSKTNGDFTATWNLGTAGGSIDNKSFKRFVGFTTQPEDGGQITFDGEDDAAFNPNGGVNFNGSLYCTIFENVIVEDAYINWRTSSSAYYLKSNKFINCEGNSGTSNGWTLTYGRSWVLIGCKAKNNSGLGFDCHYGSTVVNHFLVKCIANGNGGQGFNLGGHAGGVAIGCLAYGNGLDGFLTTAGFGAGALINCVAYDNSGDGFEFTKSNPIAINCIAKDNGGWGFYADAEVPPHVAYCCAHGNSSGQFSLPTALPEQNSIETDPQFVDAASGDFRPRNPVVLRGGKPDINGNPTQMGAILQKYQFGDRERIANMARLRIIR